MVVPLVLRRCTVSLLKPRVATTISRSFSYTSNTAAESQQSRTLIRKALALPEIHDGRLPPREEWKNYFSHRTSAAKERVLINDPKTAAALAEALVPKGSKDRVIVEAFPGPGQLTRALLDLPKKRIKRLIIMEDYEPYLKFLKPLEALDPRLRVVNCAPWSWDAYKNLEADPELLGDVPTIPWTNNHPQLQFLCQLPWGVHGEQFISQILRTIPDQMWLFKYGRFKLNFLVSDQIWSRLSAPPAPGSARCKLTVIGEAVAQNSLAFPSETLLPYDDHFHPIHVRKETFKKIEAKGATGAAFHLIQVLPRADMAIKKGDLDKWDYCLRRLYVLKASPLSKAISHLAPNAQVLLKDITSPSLPKDLRVDVTKNIASLTVRDWALLVDAFDKWPFAPMDLHVSDGFTEDRRVGQ